MSMNAETRNFTQDATKGESAIPTMPLAFKWPYGFIQKLSLEEQAELNRPRKNGTHKRHFLHCSLCGNGGPGVLQYRKESQGTTVFLCQQCAEEYAAKAMALIKTGVV